MKANKYRSSAGIAVWEQAAKIHKIKYEQQMKANKVQVYATLFFAATLVLAITANILYVVFS